MVPAEKFRTHFRAFCTKKDAAQHTASFFYKRMSQPRAITSEAASGGSLKSQPD